MNSFQSLRLIRELYFKKGLPDLDLIQSYGLLAVKIGQIHALRLDFLSAEKCQHLAQLYRRNSPVPAEDVEELLRAHGGERFKDNFASIEAEPLAVASVGQVYRAALRDGTAVVIKVIKKDFKDRFRHDVRKVRRFFKLALLFNPKLKSVGNPLGILDDIESYTLAELDLRNEARGQRVLRELYEAHKDRFDLSMLAFNMIHEKLSGENVLVSDYIAAPTLDELLDKKAFSYEQMLKFFYLQGFYMFIAGAFHGDIHPGNIMYGGKQFYFVDCAFIGRVGERIRRGLFFFFEALSRYDYDECAKQLNNMAEEGLEGAAYERFAAGLKALYADYRGKTVSEKSLTKQMMLTIKHGVNSGLRFEKGIFAVIRCLMYLDGMVLKSNPEAVLMEDMRAFVEEYAAAV